ncbi:MAG TPA: DUF6350 family protein [Actinophytocola sp.]|jgi:hypothetical protein|nr:DUF6350 family protein [Actinophytocola sp.]
MAPSLELDAANTDDVDISTVARVRVLTFAAVGSLVTGYAAIAALLALVTAVAPLAQFSTTGVVVAALPAWLAAHQVPIVIGGLELGMLPLLPTAGMMLIAARAASGAAERLRLTGPWQAGHAVAAIAVAHGAGGVAVALAVSGHDVSVDPLAAFYYPALIAALAATCGVVRRCGLWSWLESRTDAVALGGLRAGALAVLLLLAAGGAVLTVALLSSLQTAKDLFAASAPGFGNGLGMLLLSAGYVPNAVVAAVGFLAGPGFSMGIVTVSPLDFTGGPVPGLPLLAALPEEAAAWWPALFLVPVAVGVVVGRRLRYVSPDPVARFRAVAVAAGVVAVVFVVLAGSAGGRVGQGPFDPVSLRAAAVSMALVAWVAVPAVLTAWLGGPRPSPDDLDADQLPADDVEADDPAVDDAEPGEPDAEDAANAEESDDESESEDQDDAAPADPDR